MVKFKLGILVVLFYQLTFAQNIVFGYVKGIGNKYVNLAEVRLGEDGELQVKSDRVGYFQFKNIPPGEYKLTINKVGYIPLELNFTLSAQESKKDLGEIELEYNPSQGEVGFIDLTDDDFSVEEDPNIGQTGVTLLQASRDAVSKIMAFQLGSYWVKARGVDSRYNKISINGIPMEKARTGRPDFSNWGGLNRVFRYPYELVENNNLSDYSFSDLGGSVYYDTRASSYRKGIHLSYSFSNRSYQHRTMATYSSGMLPSGWALTLSGSRRWMEEGIVKGTFNDSYAYFLSTEKKISEKHRINFTAFGTPSKKGGSSPNTQEVYDLAGKDYNAYWGWQNGKKRNEREKKIFEPVFMLSHYWNVKDKTKITNSISYQFGENKSTRLNRYQAENPSPIYYKNLPSYWDYLNNTTQRDFLIDAWRRKDPLITQINWDKLYFANYNAPFYVDPYYIDPNTGETVGIQGRRASYFLVDDVIKDKTLNLSSHLQTELADFWKLYFNINYQNLDSDNYREVNDLLGADFVVNKNPFLKGDGTNTSIDDYNILRPGSVARKGDKTEYYYKFFRQEVKANLSTKILINKWELGLSALLGWNESYRDGKFMHGLYADNSYGKSKKQNFIDVGMRTGITYKINGRNFITINSAYFEASPSLDEIFPNARLSNQVTTGIKDQKINTNDLSYNLRAPKIKMRASAYYTNITNATEVSRYYTEGISLEEEDGNAFISEVVTGLRKEYLGAEVGIEWQVIPVVTLSGMASLGQYVYKNNPEVYIFSDAISGVTNYGQAYLKNYKIAGTPQKVYSLGLTYNSPKYWWVSLYGNFLQDIYSDISALARTNNFITDANGEPYPGITQSEVRALLKQKQFQDVFMLNANLGKTFRLGGYNMGMNVSVNNVLNERGYVTGAFEQGRTSSFDKAVERKFFSERIFYDRGRTYLFSVYLSF